MKFRYIVSACVSFAAVLVASCGGGGGGGISGTGAAGTLRISLTDAPSCGYDAVNITVEKVRVHQDAGAGDNDAGWSEIVLSPAKRVDLLTLTNGVLEELGQTQLPAGHYTQLRLVLAANDGAHPLANSVLPTGSVNEIALMTPSAQQSGIKANINIDVADNQLADFVIDFDACKSVVKAGNSGKYLLKPVITVVPHFVSGVAGLVDTSLLGPLTGISLQSADGAVIKSTVADSSGAFLLQPVAPGSYDLVITAPGRATAVVTGLVVATDLVTTVSSTPINPPASGSGTLDGAVDTGVKPVDASVAVRQALTTGPTITLADAPVDATTGAYTHSLATAPPVVATALAPSTFVADPAAAGRFTLKATSNGVSKTVPTAPPMLTTGATITTDFTFP